MKTIIAGCRSFKVIHNKYKRLNLYQLVCNAVEDSKFSITKVISGGAAGVDLLGERWARERGIPIERFLPDWDMYRGLAGHVRNVQMAKKADALIAIWDGVSEGTRDMIGCANSNKINVFVFRVDL